MNMMKHLYDKFMDWFCNDGKTNNSVWFYSDPHFSDLESYKLRFPTTFQKGTEYMHSALVKNLDDEQIKNINLKCGKNDTLVILGDVGNIDCVKRLKAFRKVLITGNHDRGASYYLRHIENKKIDISDYMSKSPNDISFEAMEKYPDDRELQEQYELKHFNAAYNRAYKDLKKNENFVDLTPKLGLVNYSLTEVPYMYWTVTYDNKLFDEVYDGALIVGPKIILSHEPVTWRYGLNIHGHVHLPVHYDEPGHLNVCADQINYIPICFTDIIKQGRLKFAMDIHRETIDRAIINKQK